MAQPCRYEALAKTIENPTHRGKTVPTSFSLSPLHSDVNHETPINEQQYRIPRTHNSVATIKQCHVTHCCPPLCVCVCTRVCTRQDGLDLFTGRASKGIQFRCWRSIVVPTSSRHCIKNQARYKRLRTDAHTRTLSSSLSFHFRSTQTAGFVDRRTHTVHTGTHR